MHKNHHLQKLTVLVKDDIQNMDRLIMELTSHRAELIFLLSNYLVSSGGKRLRPIMTLLGAQLFGYSGGNRHIKLAAAIEFIHNATLLHDDVVDESNLRRGIPSANHKWGNKASILVGDFLLSQAFQLMVGDGSLRVLDILSNASAVIAEGEVMQLAAVRNLEISEEQYIKIISSKTAELFAAACQVCPVITAQDNDTEMAMRQFGMNLGIAFQMIDDVLDYMAEQEELGKALGDDFHEGKITLPVILCYQQATPSEREFWVRTMQELEQSEDDLRYATELMCKYDVFARVIQYSKNYIDQARDIMMRFPDSPAKSAFLEVLEFALARSY